MKISVVDQELVIDALAALRLIAPERAGEIDGVLKRVAAATPTAITVGVFGGVVQWVQGNPCPIRIIDYDGEADNLLDRDDEGMPCSLSYAEPDPDLVAAQR